jgi:hypothetical protein
LISEIRDLSILFFTKAFRYGSNANVNEIIDIAAMTGLHYLVQTNRRHRNDSPQNGIDPVDIPEEEMT